MGAKKSALLALWEEVRNCQKCPLGATARNKVFGDGLLQSPLMLVGEAPGEEEDVSGHPFVGAAGKILTDALRQAGIERNWVFIANGLKCHPPKFVDTRRGNRKPKTEEMTACRPYLIQQIMVIRPRVIMVMGDSAHQVLMQRGPIKVGELFGRREALGGLYDPAPDVTVTYHPSYFNYQWDSSMMEKYVALFRREWEWAMRTESSNGSRPPMTTT